MFKPTLARNFMSSQRDKFAIFDVCGRANEGEPSILARAGRSGSGDGGSREGKVLSTEGKVQWRIRRHNGRRRPPDKNSSRRIVLRHAGAQSGDGALAELGTRAAG